MRDSNWWSNICLTIYHCLNFVNIVQGYNYKCFYAAINKVKDKDTNKDTSERNYEFQVKKKWMTTRFQQLYFLVLSDSFNLNLAQDKFRINILQQSKMTVYKK